MYNKIDWELGISANSEEGNSGEFKFIETVNDSYLHEHCRNPTRFPDGQRSTLDDLVLKYERASIRDLQFPPMVY